MQNRVVATRQHPPSVTVLLSADQNLVENVGKGLQLDILSRLVATYLFRMQNDMQSFTEFVYKKLSTKS